VREEAAPQGAPEAERGLEFSRAGEYSLLLVHAHPDDESIGTGATMAKYAASGARVTLVTCTLGEIGEIIPPDLQYLLPDELGSYRIGELQEACEALGVTDHRFLGGPGRYRDSGMIGMEENEDSRCFWRASVPSAARELAAIIDEVRPSVIVTYDANGFYGHPDHIQAHRVAWAARALAAPSSRFYATAMPLSAQADAAKLPADSWFEPWLDFSSSVPDDQVTTTIDGSPYLGAKLAAMRAHATQITVDGEFYALSNNRGHRVLATEYYVQLAGPDPAPADDLFGPESLR
jgi:N-acetyl-1-D-myo-inositol-2-amino-2-deoxy-alpha-D-glucopyranoside deacetylase